MVLDAIQQPIKVLARNSGCPTDAINNCREDEGIDFALGDYKPVDLIDKGILDPAKVLRVSIEHAVAVAILILNTKCVIEPDENIIQY